MQLISNVLHYVYYNFMCVWYCSPWAVDVNLWVKLILTCQKEHRTQRHEALPRRLLKQYTCRKHYQLGGWDTRTPTLGIFEVFHKLAFSCKSSRRLSARLTNTYALHPHSRIQLCVGTMLPGTHFIGDIYPWYVLVGRHRVTYLAAVRAFHHTPFGKLDCNSIAKVLSGIVLKLRSEIEFC